MPTHFNARQRHALYYGTIVDKIRDDLKGSKKRV